MTRIVILVHRDQDFEEVGYYLRDIAAAWRAQAHEVIVVSDTDRRVRADLAILHVDLSVVPDAYLAWLADYPLHRECRGARYFQTHHQPAPGAPRRRLRRAGGGQV